MFKAIRDEVELYVYNDTILAPLWKQIQEGLIKAARDTGVPRFHWTCGNFLFKDKGLSSSQDTHSLYEPLFVLCRLYGISIYPEYSHPFDLSSGGVVIYTNTTNYIVTYTG